MGVDRLDQRTGDRERTTPTEALRARGVERYAAGDLEAAASLWREALELAPDDIQAEAYVAWAESQLAIRDPGEGGARGLSSLPPGVFSAETVDPIGAIPEETRRSSPDVTLSWYPSRAGMGQAQLETAHAQFEGAEAPVRRFLAHAPTRPNLAPVEDVHVLSEERLAELAGWQRPAPPLPADSRAAAAAAPLTLPSVGSPEMAPSSAMVEMEAEPEPLPGEESADHDAVPRRISGEPSTRKVQFPFAERVLAARRSIDRGDLEAAVLIAEEVVDAAGGLDASLIAEQVPTLSMIYERVLGRRDRLVSLGVLPPELDPRSAFLLSRVDGSFSLDDLLDISGMERSEAFRLVALLMRSGALLPG